MPQSRRLLLAGTWTSGASAREVRSPHDGSVLGEIAEAGPGDLDRAADEARKAFGTTRGLPAFQRSDILRKTSDLLAKRRESIAQTIAGEAGKPLRLARAEVDRAVSTFSFAAEEAHRIGGEVIPLDAAPGGRGRLGIARRFPLGPVLAITPFNFPLNLAAHKVAPAMAAGNPVVLKPASATPLTALALGETLLEAGWPPPAISVMPCPGSQAARLVADPRFRLVTFTGSPAVGWTLRGLAGTKRVALELGGNAAAIVHEDGDLDLAVDRCVHGAYAYSGQVCISVQRIYVHRPVYERFLAGFVARTEKLAAGDPLDEKTDLGPLIDDAAADRVDTWLREASQAGARTRRGGARRGRFIEATVLEEARPGMKVHDAEVFGPVANLYPYDDFEEALRGANDSPYGLQAGLFTRDARRIFRAHEALDVGGVIVDDAPTFRVDHMPYGGEKASGQGREGLRYAIEEMTVLRLLALNLA